MQLDNIGNVNIGPFKTWSYATDATRRIPLFSMRNVFKVAMQNCFQHDNKSYPKLHIVSPYVKFNLMYNGPLTRYVKLQVAHAPGMPGTFPPAAYFKGNRWLAIPACITARAWRTCRDACRDRLPAVTGKTFPAFPAHAHPQICVSGKRPMAASDCSSLMWAAHDWNCHDMYCTQRSSFRDWDINKRWPRVQWTLRDVVRLRRWLLTSTH